MKRPLVLLTTGLALVPDACTAPAAEAPTSPAEVTPASTEAPAPAEPPTPDWMVDQPASTFLDAEQQVLSLRVYSAASSLMGYSTSGVDNYLLDGNGPPELRDYEAATLDSGRTYLVAQGWYAQREDFQAMLDSIFTSTYQKELLWMENMDGERFPIFTAGGKDRTYFLELERDSGLEYDQADVPGTCELVSQNKDTIEFYLAGHYASLIVQPDETSARPLSTERWSVCMERTTGGQRVSEFHMPYWISSKIWEGSYPDESGLAAGREGSG